MDTFSQKVSAPKIGKFNMGEKLFHDTKEYLERREEMERELKRKRETMQFKVHLGKLTDEEKYWDVEISPESKLLEIHRDKSVEEATEAAAELWGVKKSTLQYRLRHLNTKFNLLTESYEQHEYYPLSRTDLDMQDSLVLETAPPEFHFVAHNFSLSIIALIKFEKHTLTFSQPLFTVVRPSMSFNKFKELVSALTGIPTNSLRIFQESFSSYYPAEEVSEYNLRLSFMHKGTKFYVEEGKTKGFSPCMDQLETIANQITVSVNPILLEQNSAVDISDIQFTKEIKIDKRQTVSDFLQLMAMVCNFLPSILTATHFPL